MNEKNKNLVKRVVSALVLLPVVLFLIIEGGYWAAVLMAVVAGICAHEYFSIVGQGKSPAAIVGVICAFVTPLLPLWSAHSGELVFWTIAFFFIFAWTYHLIRGPLKEAPTLVAHLLTGLLYGAVGLYAVSAIRLGHDGLRWLICVLVITWVNDTAAYFAGRFLGKHKLYPEVSPNKTWEGFAGGFVGSVGGMFAAKAIFFPELHALDCLVVGAAGGVLGPIGDLCESMLKRAYGVKDSGRIIPGHGGLLDRIDALIFNAPMVLLYVRFLRPLLFS